MKPHINFFLNNLGPNQLAYYLITQGNRYENLTAFYENEGPKCTTPLFATMNLLHALDHDRITVATALSNACMLKETLITKKLFYVWDLEWIRKVYDVENLFEVYQSMPLIARSKEHAKLLENCWNANVIGVCKNFDFSILSQLVLEV